MRLISVVRDLLQRAYRDFMEISDRPERHVAPVELAALLPQVAGKWVALRNGEIIEARDTFDQVVMALDKGGVRDATVMRSPSSQEVELVGLG